jgi:hypothetical protein
LETGIKTSYFIPRATESTGHNPTHFWKSLSGYRGAGQGPGATAVPWQGECWEDEGRHLTGANPPGTRVQPSQGHEYRGCAQMRKYHTDRTSVCEFYLLALGDFEK